MIGYKLGCIKYDNYIIRVIIYLEINQENIIKHHEIIDDFNATHYCNKAKVIKIIDKDNKQYDEAISLYCSFSKLFSSNVIKYKVNQIIELNDKEMKSHDEIQFYKNINIVSTFGLDIKNGHEIIYWPNGNKLRECCYVNGELDGKYFEWYSNGKGEAQGFALASGTSDKIMINCNYKNGKLDGNYEDRLKNGKIRVVCKYENDKMIGDRMKILLKRLLNPL